MTDDLEAAMDERDRERFELLDRIDARIPGFDLGQHSIEWVTAPNGTDVLTVDGGWRDRSGYELSIAGDQLVYVGGLDPLINDSIGSVTISADGSWRIHRAVPDPQAGQPE